MDIFRSGIAIGLYFLRFKDFLLPNTSFIVATRPDCAARCLRDKACVSFFYNTKAGTCYYYDTTVAPDHTALFPVNGIIYYVNKEKAGLCARPYTQKGRYCVTVHNRRLKWDKANAICKRQRSHLLRIDTAEKNSYFLKQFPYLVRKGFWLGGDDRATEGTWRWSDGSLVHYTYWARREPDGGVNQNCLALMYEKTTSENAWSSVGCFDKRSFLCERS